MPKFIAQLGNTPALSMAELQAVYPDLKIDYLQNDTAWWEADNFDADQAMNRLGGTVKILEVVKEFDEANPENLNQELLRILSQQEGKVKFAIGEIGRDHLPVLDESTIKESLKSLGISSRFIESPRSGLSASVLLHQKVTELVVIQAFETTVVGKSLAVQNIDDWTVRDRQKPYADRKKGMLPPKVARMMVNLAIGQTEATEAVKILDPFCGSGTILMEAGVLGFNVIGSDLDPESATGSQNNLEWLRSEYNLDFKSQVFQKDATRLQLATKITHLVTEPFLGKPAPKSEQLPNIFRGLSKLYLGAFKQWTTLLADDASLVVVFPESEDPITKKRFSLEGLFDKLSILGYTEVSDALIYHRPNATIERAIHQFKFRRK